MLKAAVKLTSQKNKGGSVIDNKKSAIMGSMYSCIFADTESAEEVFAKVADFFDTPDEFRPRFILQYKGIVPGHNASAIRPVEIEISIDFYNIIFGSRALS